MRLFFALLALLCNAAVVVGVGVAIAGRRSAGAAEIYDRIRAAVRGRELAMGFLVALVATLGSLYFSEIAHFEPCRYCWFQRIAMYPLVPVLGVAAWRKDGGARLSAGLLAGSGLVLSTYHYLLQRFPSLDGGSCSVGIPCTAAYVDEFGFISIPYMAFSGFAFILMMLVWSATDSVVHEPSSMAEASA